MPARHRSLPRRHPGLTLIEILASIAVIVLLASALFPALQSARAKHDSVRSVSNLRQLGGAMLQFASENAGQFPPTAAQIRNESGGWAYLGSWDSLILPYLGVDVPAHHPNPEGNYRKIARVGSIFSNANDQSPQSAPQSSVRRGYAMAAGAGMVGISTWSGTEITLSESLAQIEQPSRTILLTEKPGYSNNTVGRTGEAGIKSPEEQMVFQPALNGSGTFHYLFCDGHVESLMPDTTIGSGTMDQPKGLWLVRKEN